MLDVHIFSHAFIVVIYHFKCCCEIFVCFHAFSILFFMFFLLVLLSIKIFFCYFFQVTVNLYFCFIVLKKLFVLLSC